MSAYELCTLCECQKSDRMTAGPRCASSRRLKPHFTGNHSRWRSADLRSVVASGQAAQWSRSDPPPLSFSTTSSITSPFSINTITFFAKMRHKWPDQCVVNNMTSRDSNNELNFFYLLQTTAIIIPPKLPLERNMLPHLAIFTPCKNWCFYPFPLLTPLSPLLLVLYSEFFFVSSFTAAIHPIPAVFPVLRGRDVGESVAESFDFRPTDANQSQAQWTFTGLWFNFGGTAKFNHRDLALFCRPIQMK